MVEIRSWGQSDYEKPFREGRDRPVIKFWNNGIYKVVSVHKDLPIYQVQPEKDDSKIKTVHRNPLLLCNQLPSEKSHSKEVLYKRPQPPPSVNSDFASDSELVFIRRRKIKASIINNNVEIPLM